MIGFSACSNEVPSGATLTAASEVAVTYRLCSDETIGHLALYVGDEAGPLIWEAELIDLASGRTELAVRDEVDGYNVKSHQQVPANAKIMAVGTGSTGRNISGPIFMVSELEHGRVLRSGGESITSERWSTLDPNCTPSRGLGVARTAMLLLAVLGGSAGFLVWRRTKHGNKIAGPMSAI